jgi:hypothetical protein
MRLSAQALALESTKTTSLLNVLHRLRGQLEHRLDCAREAFSFIRSVRVPANELPADRKP